MGFVNKALKVGGMGGGPGVGMLGATGAGIAATALGRGERKDHGWIVPQGHVGVRTFLGKVGVDRRGNLKLKVGKAGPHPLTVLSHSYKFISVQNRMSNLGVIPFDRIEAGEKKNYTVQADFGWRVYDGDDHYPYRALFKPIDGDLEQMVVVTGRESVSSVMSTIDLEGIKETALKEWNNANNNREMPLPQDVGSMYAQGVCLQAIYNRVQLLSYEALDENGVISTSLSIGSNARSPEEVSNTGLISAATQVEAGMLAIAGAIESLGRPA